MVALAGFLVLVILAIALWAVVRQPTNSLPEPEYRVFFAQVHGINHKNDDGSSRQSIIARCREGEELMLVPEPTNHYDPGAVKICRKNGEQLGYWTADGRMAKDLAIGWTYRVSVDEIYAFKENRNKHGIRLRVEVLTMSNKTEERKKRAAKMDATTEQQL